MRLVTALAFGIPALLAIVALVLGYRDGRREFRRQMDLHTPTKERR